MRPSVAPGRVEIPTTRRHWEAAYVAPVAPLARGWERQLDIAENTIFYTEGALTAESYRDWLFDSGVTYVALPDVALDYSARAEAALLRQGLPYLRPVWHNDHWQLWRVVGSPGMVSGAATLVSIEPDRVVLHATGVGPVVVKVRYAGWSVPTENACVLPTPDRWTEVDVTQPGDVALVANLTGHDRCPTTDELGH